MKKKKTVQITESRVHGSPRGAAKEAVSCERCSRLTASAVLSDPPDLLHVLCPDYYYITFQQPVAFSTGKFPWLGPLSPKVVTRLVPGLELRGFLVLLARPLAGSGAAVPDIFKILFWFAGTCFPTVIVYSC